MSRTLDLVQRLQAIAQSGLAYSPNPYDVERFEALREISAELMAMGGGLEMPELDVAFRAQLGYATPKIDVRGAVFADDKVLLVRERADNDRWTLPGGWADVGLGPVDNVLKEIREESGIEAEVVKLAAIYDHGRHAGHTRSPFHIWKHFFICKPVGGLPRTSIETSEVRYFAASELPDDLSTARCSRAQLVHMFEHKNTPGLQTEMR
jgi:ADP-ribose pyrophosphatase YjhB (NUDIX family)